MERSLVEIWKRLLKVSEISIEDNFFEIGGDSLIAMQLVVEISVLSTIRVNLSFLYQAPTIQKLAALLEEPEQNIKFQYLSTYRDKGSLPPLFCAPGLNGKSLRLKEIAGLVEPEMPVIGINGAELSDGKEVFPDFETLIEDFVADIERYQPSGPIHLLGYSIGGIYAFAIAELLLKRGREIGWLGLIDTTPILHLPQNVKWLVQTRMLIISIKKKLTKSILMCWRRARGKPAIAWFKFIVYRTPCVFVRLLKKLNSILLRKIFKPKRIILPTENNQQDYYAKITMKYSLLPTRLRLTLFIGNSKSAWSYNYWKKFALHGVEFISVPLSHGDFFKPENIQYTANCVNNALKRVSR